MATRLQRIAQRKKIFKAGALIIAFLLVVGITGVVYRFLGFYDTIHTEAQENKELPKEKDQYNILLLGYGGGTHEGTYLTDTLMVAHIDLKQKKVLLLSLPRDIWVKVPTKNDDFHSKINAVYQMGLFPEDYPDVDTSLLTEDNASGLIKKVVQDITGLKIDAFAAVDFQGFITTIDTLEGIEVDVARSFTDYEYPIEGKENDLCGKDEEFAQIEKYFKPGFDEEEKKKLFEEKPELETFFKNITESPVEAFPCRYETLSFEKGKTHMDGETALKFARSRHSLEDGGDFNRAQRQQKVLEAVKNKVLSVNFIPKILPLLDQLEENITTDLPLSDTNKLLLEGRNANQYEVSTFVISNEYLADDYSDGGQFIVIPKEGIDNWSAVQRKVNEIIMGISPTPTKPPSSTIAPN